MFLKFWVSNKNISPCCLVSMHCCKNLQLTFVEFDQTSPRCYTLTPKYPLKKTATMYVSNESFESNLNKSNFDQTVQGADRDLLKVWKSIYSIYPAGTSTSAASRIFLSHISNLPWVMVVQLKSKKNIPPTPLHIEFESCKQI